MAKSLIMMKNVREQKHMRVGITKTLIVALSMRALVYLWQDVELDTLLEASTRNEQQNRYSRLSLSIDSLQDPLKPRIRSFPHLLHVSEQNHVRYQHGRWKMLPSAMSPTLVWPIKCEKERKRPNGAVLAPLYFTLIRLFFPTSKRWLRQIEMLFVELLNVIFLVLFNLFLVRVWVLVVFCIFVDCSVCFNFFVCVLFCSLGNICECNCMYVFWEAPLCRPSLLVHPFLFWKNKIKHKLIN